MRHYLFGNGEIAWLGNSTIEKLINSEKFQYHHNRIISGKTEDLSGDFSVDLEGEVFHVGNTNVDYSIFCEGDNCSVMYTMFARDGFWDVDYADEFIGGRILGIERYKTDGMGPNLERIGGTPYPYMPIIGTFLFPNPGY